MFDLVPVGVFDRRRDGLFGFVRAEDNPDHASFGFLADQFGGLPVVDVPKRPKRRGSPWNAPRLGALAFEQVKDPLRFDPDGLKRPPGDRVLVAGVIREKPISGPPTDSVVFDPIADLTSAAGIFAVLPLVQVIRFKNLKLNRNREAVRTPPGALDREGLAAFDHASDGKRLNPVKVRMTVGVAELLPFFEKGVDLGVQVLVLGLGAGANARPDKVIHKDRHGAGGGRVVPDKIAHPIPKDRGGGGDFGVGGFAGRRPTVGPPPLRGPVIGAGHVRQRDSRRKTLRRPFGRESADQAVDDP